MLLDIIVAIIVTLGFYLGYSRGLIKTVFDAFSLLVAVVASLKLSPITMEIIQSLLKTSPAVTFLLGVVVTFLAVIMLIRFIGRKFEDILKAVNINFINKLAGGALQALFFAYLLSLFLWLLANIKIIKPEVQARSITWSLLEPLPEKGKAVFQSLKPVFTKFWDKTLEAMDSVKEKNEKN
jgi:membrane protein required for colicin V production